MLDDNEQIVQITQSTMGLLGLSNKGVLCIWSLALQQWERMPAV